MNNNENENENIKNVSMAGVVIRLIVIFAVAAAVIVFVTCYKLENIEIRPGSHYTEEEIRSRLFTKKTDKYAVLFAYRINKINIPDIPFVEKVDVELVDKNSVIVYVYDKAVIGCIEHMGKYVYFDREGIVVDSSSEKLEGIPSITGVAFNGYTMNEPLDIGSPKIFDTILEILLLLEKNSLTADEIEFGLRGDVILYMSGDKVLLGRSENYDFRINNLANILRFAPEGNFSFDMRNYNEKNMEVDARPLD